MHKVMTTEQQAAWRSTLTEEGRVIALCPVGRRFTAVIIALLKRALIDCTMPPAERLQMLEGIANCKDVLSEPIIAAIDPACDTALKMAREAKYDLDALADHDVFTEFVRLNPSLRAVLATRFSPATKAARG